PGRLQPGGGAVARLGALPLGERDETARGWPDLAARGLRPGRDAPFPTGTREGGAAAHGVPQDGADGEALVREGKTMKLCTILTPAGPRLGAMTERGVLELEECARRHPDASLSVRQ